MNLLLNFPSNQQDAVLSMQSTNGQHESFTFTSVEDELNWTNEDISISFDLDFDQHPMAVDDSNGSFRTMLTVSCGIDPRPVSTKRKTGSIYGIDCEHDVASKMKRSCCEDLLKAPILSHPVSQIDRVHPSVDENMMQEVSESSWNLYAPVVNACTISCDDLDCSDNSTITSSENKNGLEKQLEAAQIKLEESIRRSQISRKLYIQIIESMLSNSTNDLTLEEK